MEPKEELDCKGAFCGMQIVVLFNTTASFKEKSAIKDIIIKNGGILSYIITKKVILCSI